MPRFNSDGSLKSKFFLPFFIYELSCSKTELVTDMQLVCKSNFARYGHLKKKSVLYVSPFYSDGPLKSEVSHFQNLRFFNFQALDPKFVLAL